MSGSHHHDSGSENLKVAFFLNLAFTVIEVIGGILTNSIAILSDAVHDLGDSLSLGLAWYFEKLSRKERSAKHTFGYVRFRLLGGLITGITLLIGLGFVLWQAIQRLQNPEEVNAHGMIGLAVLGIVFNGAAVLRLRKGSSLTEKIVSWHLFEDLLGWVAVLIGSGIMAVWDLPIIDPILSILISLIILWNVWRNLGKVGRVFLQTAPEGFDFGEFQQKVLALPEVESLHHPHSWSLDGEEHVLTMHIVRTSDPAEDVELKNRIRAMLDGTGFSHVTLEMEAPEDLAVEKAAGYRD
ncbi:MAG: cation diffusion facilitator family transporter [Verrucomicrobiales bacterium]|nr:cation diffusion facilitator family transporter [Verrucomicrobiales bacterium]